MKKLEDLVSQFLVPMRDKPKVFDGDIPWCRIEDIEGDYLHGSKSGKMVSENTVDEMNLVIFPAGTVIVSCSARMGICAITTTPLITNQTFIGLVCGPELDPRYLLHYMNASKQRLEHMATGATVRYLSRKKFETFEIDAPPIDEQKRIATILDKANSLCNLIERLKSEKDVFIFSLFASMFGNVVSNSFNFPTQKLGEVVSIKLGQSPSGESYNEDGIGVPFLQGNAEFTSLHPVHKKYTSEPNRMSKIGDVLLSVRAPVGAINIADREYCIGRGLAAIEPNEELNQAYLQYCLEFMKEILQSKATGSTFKAVTGRVLKSFEIPIPPISLQQRFAFLLSKTRDIDYQEGIIRFTELQKSVIQEVIS